MNILFMGNNRLGADVLEWLHGRDESIVGLLLHPEENRSFGSRFEEVSPLPEDRRFSADDLEDPEFHEEIASLEPDIGISVLFGYIFPPEFIDLFPRGIINLHPAYLPYNRGQYPNVWSIVEETPAGATLHYVDEDIDTGDIIERVRVPVEPIDTGRTLYQKLEQASFDLFRRVWPKVCQGTAGRAPQTQEDGTYHQTDDVLEIDEINLDDNFSARELINILRARTFPPYDGAYFVEDGHKIYMRLSLYYGGDADEE